MKQLLATIVFTIAIFAGFTARADVSPREHSLQRIEVRNLKKEIGILTHQYNMATGVHKIKLEKRIERLQNLIHLIVNGKTSCK